MKEQIKAETLAELPAAAQNILNLCSSQKIFAIYGEMGAGKTTLVKAIVQKLGAKDEVASPTFSLINEYVAEESIYHIDLYRLNSKQEALDIGIEEYIYSGHYCFIEWPGLVADLLPENAAKITITADNTGTRHILVEAGAQAEADD